jgi:hypothetical protein
MAEDTSEPSEEADGSQGSQPVLSAGFDRYRSLADPNLMIFVAKDVVPPFRFKTRMLAAADIKAALPVLGGSRYDGPKGLSKYETTQFHFGARRRGVCLVSDRPGTAIECADNRISQPAITRR